MKLITKAIENQLLKHPLYSTNGKNDKDVLVKFFNPCGVGTWYVFEAEKNGDDWTFFGLVDLHEKELGYFTLSELGYFTLSELQSIKLPFGMTIERDKYFEGYKYNSATGVISNK